MLLKITELNAWEMERWSYIVDLDKQDGEAINQLMIFIRVANEHFEECKEQVHARLFAASRYSFGFYNSVSESNDRYYVLYNKSKAGGLHVKKDGGYKSSMLAVDEIISVKKMRGAVIRMKKGENELYKNFECLFLKKVTVRI